MHDPAPPIGPVMDLSPDRVPPRDRYGHLIHPGLLGLEGDEPIEPVLRALGFDVATSWMDNQQKDRYIEQGDPDCSWWTPEAPEGAHWTPVLLQDTEEHGPVAVFVRPYRLSPSPPLVSWGVFDRPLDYPEGVIARAFHGGRPTSIRVRGASVEEIVAHLPGDLTYLARQPDDPPYLVCSAIGTCTADLSVCG